VALIIQIRLAQHNLEAAEKELIATKSWAQDSLLAQLAEVCGVSGFANHRHGWRLLKEEIVFKEPFISMKSLLSQRHPLQNPSSVKE